MVSKEVFSIWFDHGESPLAGTDHYIVVPGIDASGVEKLTENMSVKILSNSGRVQAAPHEQLQLKGIVFHHPGSVETGPTV